MWLWQSRVICLLLWLFFNLNKCVHCFLSARLRRSLRWTLSCPWKIIWYQVGKRASTILTYNGIVTLLTVILFKSGHQVPTLRPLRDLRVCAPGRWSQSIWEPSKSWIVKCRCKSLSHKQQMHSELPFTRSVRGWACVSSFLNAPFISMLLYYSLYYYYKELKSQFELHILHFCWCNKIIKLKGVFSPERQKSLFSATDYLCLYSAFSVN